MSVLVKLAKEIDKSHDIYDFLFVQGGADGTEKRVLASMAWPSREGWLRG